MALAGAATVGCGGGGGADDEDGGVPPMRDGATPDGSMPDGSTSPDAGMPFDPAMTYPGEGDACRFSLQCGERQVCVDDECARFERFEEEDLELGEMRVLYGPDLWEELQGPGPTVDWEQVAADDQTTWIAPGQFGSQLLFASTRGDCHLGLVGERVRSMTFASSLCAAATAAPDGRLAFAGYDRGREEHYVVLFGADGEELWRVDLGDSVAAALAEEEGDQRYAGYVTSLLFDDDRLLASMAVGGPDGSSWPATRTAFLSFDSAGEFSLLEVAGARVQSGDRGWLVHDEQGVRAVMAEFAVTDLTSLEPNGAPMDDPTVLLDLESGERRELFTGFSWHAGYGQLRANQWAYTALHVPNECVQRLFTSDGDELVTPYETEWVYCITEENFPKPLPDFADRPVYAQTVYLGVHDTAAVHFSSRVLEQGLYRRDGTREELSGDGVAIQSGTTFSRYGLTIEGLVDRGGPATAEKMGWFEAPLVSRQVDS